MDTKPSLPDGPARDSRFSVVERWAELAKFPPGDPQRRVEFYHRQMNEEVDSLECSARNITDFPAADWNLRVHLARQCSDESRHAKMFRRYFERAGGRAGEYPVISFQYRIVTAIPTLIGRLAVQNRSFEAGGIDAISAEIAEAKQRGDDEEQALFEAQLADEIGHVRFANEYINAAIKSDGRTVLAIGRAMTFSSDAFGYLMGNAAASGATYPADRRSREEAGFRSDEVELAVTVAEKIRAEDAANRAANGQAPS